MNITREEYKQARRLLRDNGKHARRWLSGRVRAVFDALLTAGDDLLQARTELGRYFAPHQTRCVIKNEIRACCELRRKPKLAA